MANDYKKDAGKAPLLAALQPFAPALYALARMMEDMKAKHELGGSRDPFNEWAQLPGAKGRMAQAMERHLLPEDCTLWDVNTKDGQHLHATHGLFNLLGALTLHLRQQPAIAAQDGLRTKAVGCMRIDCGQTHAHIAGADLSHVLERARIELQLQGERPASPELIHGPAGADWREYRADKEPVTYTAPVMWWTDDEGTWRCTCGAGRPAACACPRTGERL